MFTSWGMDERIRRAVEAERKELGEYLKQIREPDEEPGDGPDRERLAYDRGWNDCLNAIRYHLGQPPLSCSCGNELASALDEQCAQCREERKARNDRIS